MDPSVDLPPEQSGGFEDAKVLGDGREGHVERCCKSFDSGLALRETREYGAASGVGKSAKNGIEGVRTIVNHTV